MFKNMRWKILLILVTVISISLISSAQAAPLLNLELDYFVAAGVTNGVELEWRTATEFGTAGFKLKRGQNGSFQFLPDPNGTGDLFINNQGSDIAGWTYNFTDETAVPGETYSYILVVVETVGSESSVAIVTVTAGTETTALYLPVLLKP